VRIGSETKAPAGCDVVIGDPLSYSSLVERFLPGDTLRLGLVTIDQMVAALAWSVESPADGSRVLTVPEIRRHAGGQKKISSRFAAI
jgi:hypothetical protein